MTGFNSKRKAVADKLQEPVEFDAFLESQDFYELMQTYRHCQIDAHIPFEAVKDALRAVHTETALAQPAREPVALVIDGVLVKSELPEKYTGHLYTTPQQREWVGLTEDEREGIAKDYSLIGYKSPFKAIEAKLKEKNL